jgi:uncharacterized alkaline shock family protein YloU
MKFTNTLNRILVVIACLLLIAASTTLFLLPHIVLVNLGQWLLDWGNYFNTMDPWTRMGIGVALTVVVTLVLLLVIFLEVRRHRSRFIRVQQVAGGMANISTDSVVELLQHRLDPLPGVIEVTPRILAKGNRVTAHVDATVAHGTNVPHIANQLIETIQSVLTDELGLKIAGQPEVQVEMVAQREGRDHSAPPGPSLGPVPEEPKAESERDEIDDDGTDRT